METEERWLTIGDVCRNANCPKEKVQRLILEGVIPPSCIRTIDGVTRIRPGVVGSLKSQKSAWLNDEFDQPSNAVHVPDPDGVYPGFWLTPEQALELGKIRVKHRLEGEAAYNASIPKGVLQLELGKCMKNR